MFKKVSLIILIFGLILVSSGCKGIPDVAGTYIGTTTPHANLRVTGENPKKAAAGISSLTIQLTQNEANITSLFIWPSITYNLTGTIDEDGKFTMAGSGNSWNFTETGTIDGSVYTSTITFTQGSYIYIYTVNAVKQ